jgi:hypothetical protein
VTLLSTEESSPPPADSGAGTFVDSSVLLDVFTEDERRLEWSEAALLHALATASAVRLSADAELARLLQRGDEAAMGGSSTAGDARGLASRAQL